MLKQDQIKTKLNAFSSLHELFKENTITAIVVCFIIRHCYHAVFEATQRRQFLLSQYLDPITSPWMKQLTRLRNVHSGDWCLRLALCTPSSTCRKRRSALLLYYWNVDL